MDNDTRRKSKDQRKPKRNRHTCQRCLDVTPVFIAHQQPHKLRHHLGGGDDGAARQPAKPARQFQEPDKPDNNAGSDQARIPERTSAHARAC
jgi:hypothetical protein